MSQIDSARYPMIITPNVRASSAWNLPQECVGQPAENIKEKAKQLEQISGSRVLLRIKTTELILEGCCDGLVQRLCDLEK